MPFSFTCPHCGKSTEAADQYAGQTCPSATCGEPITGPPPLPENMAGTPAKKSSLVSRVIVAVAVTMAVGVLVALLLPVFQSGRAVRRQRACKSNLKQIGLALHSYYDQWQCFPPAYLAGENGRPTHSWRVLILPHLGEQTLYERYRFDEPWNSPDNLAVAKEMPSVFRCPDDWQAGPSDTSYAMLVGPGAFSEGATPTTIEDITDGVDNTIAVVETSGFGIRWTQPRDLDVEEMSYTVNDATDLGPTSNHEGCAEHLFAGGTHLAISDQINPESLHAAITRAGGEWDSDD